MKPEISICISTWCRKELLKEMLLKLENQTIEKNRYEIIICDSYSKDGTKEMIEELKKKYQNIKYINNDKNILATKRNIGIDAANSNLIVFMDDDVIPEKSFIEAHIKAHKGKKNVVYCGNIKFPIEWIEKSNYYKYRNEIHKNEKKNELKFNRIVVMNMSFKKDEFLEKVGYVSEEFIGYGGEDTELGWRISKSGLKMLFLEEALGWHYEKSPTIKHYGDKIYRLGKDGLETLLRLDENIVKETSIWSLVNKNTFKFWLYNFILNKPIGLIVEKLLIKTDKNKKMYIPILYRYYLAYRLKEGIKNQTGKKLTAENVKNGWYNE